MCVATLFAASGTLPLTLDPTTDLQLTTSASDVDGLSPQASSCLDHASSPLPQPQQQMYVSIHNASPDFEQMETIHRKKVPDRPVKHSSIVSSESQCPKSLPCGILHMIGSNTVPCTSCYILGGQNQTMADKGKHSVSNFGIEFESNNSNVLAQDEVASPSITATMDSLNSNGMNKKTWPKLEDGLFLLLNLVASIRLSSSTSLPPPESGNLSCTPNGPGYQSNQPSTSETFKSSTPPSTYYSSMDSETTGLSTVQLVEHSSCYSCQQTLMRNATVYWWDGSNESSLRTFPVENTAAVKLIRTPGHHNQSLDLKASGRGKHNATLHCSHGEAVSVDTNTATCVCTSRYFESEKILSGPKLNSDQLAIDLHWQSGGTGDTDHAFVHRFNSTPQDLGDLNDTFTLTENLLLYANSLLMMAF